MSASKAVALLALLGGGLALLLGCVLARLASTERTAFGLQTQVEADALAQQARTRPVQTQPVQAPRPDTPLLQGESFCQRRADGTVVELFMARSTTGSGCRWLTDGTTAEVGRTAVVAVVEVPGGRYALRRSTDTLKGELLTSRALILGGGAALFLALAAGLAVSVGVREDVTLNAVTRQLEALVAGDLATRGAETSHGRQRRTMAAANAVAERLQVTVERQRTFLADAAHQLRNPLVALQLRLENLEPYVTEKGGRAHARLTQDFLRLGTTLDDLVTFARATETDGGPRPVDVLRVVDERLRSWVPVAYSRKIVLRQRLPDAAVALARPGALEQAIDVLVDNALKHAPGRSEVTVVVVPTATYVEVRVEDRGRGLPVGAQAAAATRGWRHDPREAGNGLGLAIATLLVSSSGGSLQLRDRQDGVGLSAVVRLPTPAPVVSPQLLPAGRRSLAGWHQD